MNLQDYLSEFFYSKKQLLQAAKISEPAFDDLRQAGVMPDPSYVVCGEMNCSSFFGEYQVSITTEYYARDYVDWLHFLNVTPDVVTVRSAFRGRYRSEIDRLLSAGFTTSNEKLSTALEAHIESEWSHFINGTYGLCTRSGLPEDIAAKEMAIAIISELIVANPEGPGDVVFRKRLNDAVDLLDNASSPFAPHERERSSRHRLVDQVRLKYGLAQLQS